MEKLGSKVTKNDLKWSKGNKSTHSKILVVVAS